MRTVVDMSKTTKTKTTKPRFQRELVVALVVREVKRFTKDGESDAVGAVLDSLMWISNSNHHTDEDIARAVVALLPIATIDELESAAHQAVAMREEKNGASADAAEATARRILAPLGVRYAPCGCLAWAASDMCCDAGASAANQVKVGELAKALAASNPKLLAKVVHDMKEGLGSAQEAA